MSQQKSDDILNFIRNYIQREHVSPTVREICEGMNIRSTSTIHRYLNLLKKDGKIKMDSSKNRTIVVIEQQGIPVIKHVETGTKAFDACNICGYFDYHPTRKYQNLLFAVCFQETMQIFNILKGDFLIAEQSEHGEYLLISDKNGKISVICRKDFVSGQILGSLVALVREFERKE